MTTKEQKVIDQRLVSERSIVKGNENTTPWSLARQYLKDADVYWLTTVRPDGRPHVMRVLAVWVNDTLHFCTNASSRKGKNLAQNAHCAVTISADDLDLVVEGTAARLQDDTEIQCIAEAYAGKYGWVVAVRNGAFHDTPGAPTAGPPPYDVYALTPTVAFGFAQNDSDYNATKWTFS